MFVLKKIKAATLVETIVASVIIVLIFGISSGIINNVFKTSLKRDKTTVYYQIEKLNYLYDNKKLKLPYKESFNGFEISLVKADDNLLISAVCIEDKHTICSYKIIKNE